MNAVYAVKWLCLLLLTISLLGCATWQSKTEAGLSLTYASVKTLHAAATPIMDKRCMDEAVSCKAAKDTVCPKLVQCQATRQKIDQVAVNIYRGVIAGLLAVKLGTESEATGWISKVKLLFDDMSVLLSTFGLGTMPAVTGGK